MSVMPGKLLLLIIISLVCILFILLYSAQLTGEGDTAPTATQPSSQPRRRHENCAEVYKFPADIETSRLFPTLDLEPAWMQRREFWSNAYEDRFTQRKSMWPQLPLRVIVMPHSHTDPGWLKTVEGYFTSATQSILDNIVEKLTQHKNMTFIWSESSYLSMWWEQAEPVQRERLRALLASGRLEVTTGGWVMTDEANVDFFSMVDQLVEGHSFTRHQLDVRPVASWSVDSFGHGGAFPHLLSRADINNMVIMRIHYAWKEWMARHQNGDFLWKQAWEEDGSRAPLCHNFPYDIYSIKHSCGPNPQTCLGFDFRHLEGEYNEFTAHYTPINEANVKERAELLLDQYGRTGSLLPHNVVLVPLGDDFRYSNNIEFDQQYANYMKLMQFINTGDYHATVTFGTLTDYFTEVRTRMDKFPTLTGDFHVYSDIFSEGRPAYWSGYYFTRPYVKLLSRQVATKLRRVEILYSVSRGLLNKDESELPRTLLTSFYPNLVSCRRALALFQHHDAITGTSKEFVMRDYESKLNGAVLSLNKMEAFLVQYLLSLDRHNFELNSTMVHTNVKNKGETAQDEVVLDIKGQSIRTLVLVNPLAHRVERIAHTRINSEKVCIFDSRNVQLDDVQVAPFHNVSVQSRLDFGTFDVWFPVQLEPLSVSVFHIERCEWTGKPTRVYCQRCPEEDSASADSTVRVKTLPKGGVQLENQIYKLVFHPETRLLTNVTNKVNGESRPLSLEFAAYTSEMTRSGAYLLKVEEASGIPIQSPVFSPPDIADVVIVSGPVFSELRVVWQVNGESGLSSFLHTVRLTHDNGPLSEAVHIENLFDFGKSPNYRDTEMFMRLESNVDNGQEQRLFTDQAGLGMVERIYTAEANLEGNYFPVTESAYIEDIQTRLTLLVDHATGAASLKTGCLEVMVDKRVMHDDARGMGEGVYDSRPTKHRYTLLLEPVTPDANVDVQEAPVVAATASNGRLDGDSDSGSAGTRLPFLSMLGLTLSRYLEHPLSTLVWTGGSQQLRANTGLFRDGFPCDYELVNLRSWQPTPSIISANGQVSSSEGGAAGRPVQSDALLIMRRLAPDCRWTSLTAPTTCSGAEPNDGAPQFADLPAHYQPTTLTANFERVRSSDPFTLLPMEIAAFNLTFT